MGNSCGMVTSNDLQNLALQFAAYRKISYGNNSILAQIHLPVTLSFAGMVLIHLWTNAHMGVFYRFSNYAYLLFHIKSSFD